MNAAARLFNQGALSRGWVMSIFLTRLQFTIFAFVLAILASSLGVVYVTNTTRSLNADLQQTLADNDKLHVQWGQILLEKSTLLMQGRIQNVAEEELAMVFPEGKAVVVIDNVGHDG